MRLWHKDFIMVLPREQLLGQWRELSAIAGNIKNKGRPNHLLVNRIMDYKLDHFVSYAFYVRREMERRGFAASEKIWKKISDVTGDHFILQSHEDLFRYWMDDDYLTICYYNLLEKYMCDGINDSDFKKIQKFYEVLS